VRKLAAQKRVESCEAMLEQAKQDLERAGQRARMATQEQPATARVRLSDWMVDDRYIRINCVDTEEVPAVSQ